jgi:hypothetical protein
VGFWGALVVVFLLVCWLFDADGFDFCGFSGCCWVFSGVLVFGGTDVFLMVLVFEVVSLGLCLIMCACFVLVVCCNECVGVLFWLWFVGLNR